MVVCLKWMMSVTLTPLMLSGGTSERRKINRKPWGYEVNCSMYIYRTICFMCLYAFSKKLKLRQQLWRWLMAVYLGHQPRGRSPQQRLLMLNQKSERWKDSYCPYQLRITYICIILWPVHVNAYIWMFVHMYVRTYTGWTIPTDQIFQEYH